MPVAREHEPPRDRARLRRRMEREPLAAPDGPAGGPHLSRDDAAGEARLVHVHHRDPAARAAAAAAALACFTSDALRRRPRVLGRDRGSQVLRHDRPGLSARAARPAAIPPIAYHATVSPAVSTVASLGRCGPSRGRAPPPRRPQGDHRCPEPPHDRARRAPGGDERVEERVRDEVARERGPAELPSLPRQEPRGPAARQLRHRARAEEIEPRRVGDVPLAELVRERHGHRPHRARRERPPEGRGHG